MNRKKQHKLAREKTERGRGLTEKKMMFSLEQIM